MITLSELLSEVEHAPLTKEKSAPGWRELIKSGGGIAEQAMFDDGSVLEVYHNGYVFYKTGSSKTTFSLADIFEDYEYRPQEKMPDTTLAFNEDAFADLPWVIRVLMEGEDRIEASQQKSRTAMRSTEFDSTRDEHGTYGCDEDDPLTLLMRAELADMLYQSFRMMTEYQQQVVRACIMEGRKHWEIASDYDVTRQSITNAMKKGLRKFRESFEMLYGDSK